MNTEFYDPFQIDHLRERIAALEEIIGQTVAAHDRIDALARDCFIYDGRISEMKERITALECKHKDLDAWTIYQFSRLEPRIAALEERLSVLEEIAAIEEKLRELRLDKR